MIDYAKDSKGTSCLHVAVQKGHAHIVDFLCKRTLMPKDPPLKRRGTIAKIDFEEMAQKKLMNQAIIWERQIDIDE